MSETGFVYDKKKFYNRLNKSLNIVKSVLSQTFSLDEIDSIIVETFIGVEALLPSIPYIGGKENISLHDYFDAIMMLALFKELNRKGMSARDIGQVMYEIRERQAQSLSKVSRFIASKLMFSSFTMRNYKKKIKILTDKGYPENWHMEFIEGDGIEFDWGINFHDCAVHKLYKKHGADELLPYVCMSDYAMLNVLKNVEFKRTQTLSGGALFCDFRFKKGGSTPRGWPPEKLPDFKVE